MKSRGLTIQFLQRLMVLSGLSFQRVLSSAVLAMLLSALVNCLRAAEPGNIVGTMPEDYLPELRAILAEARKRSPEMIARDFERVMAEARLTMAKAARLPNLGGNFDYGVSQTAVSSNTSSRSRSTGAQYNFNAGQALFHWGAIKNEVEISKLNLRGNAMDTVRLWREVTTALRKAYLALIVQKARLRQARESMALVRADVRVAEARKQDGTISAAVLEGEKLRLRETELQLNRVTTLFETERRSFARVAGLPELAEEAIPNDIPRPPVQEALASALAAKTLRENARGTMEWEAYDIKLEEALRRLKIANVRLYPKFGLGASFGQRNNTSVNGAAVSQEAVTEQRVAVSGSWAVFDGFATRGAKREAAASRRAIEHRQKTAIDELLETVQQLERALKLDAEQVELAEIRHGIAVAGQELVREGVQMGDRPKADIDRGEVNILGAHATSLEARAQYLMRWAELVSTTSTDPLLNYSPDRDVRPKK